MVARGRSSLIAKLDFGAHPELLAVFPYPHRLELAIRLIDTLKTEWDPNAYADTYREELLRILSEKSPTAAPQPIVPAGTGPSAVEELMSALRESVEAAKARAEKKGSRSKRAG